MEHYSLYTYFTSNCQLVLQEAWNIAIYASNLVAAVSIGLIESQKEITIGSLGNSIVSKPQKKDLPNS